MKISTDHLSKLARLSLADEEKVRFGIQLESIISYMDKLNELDTKDIEPTSHVISICNVIRDDLAEPSLPREEALRNAPDSSGEFYRVPKIIE
jgi:aspartyl-tRNA(Asn)/glutamyl-tRNA(Gln) amidotransferase subunit C